MNHDHHHHHHHARHRPTPSTPVLDRRRWMLGSAATAAAAFGAASVGNLLLGSRPAHAADYKALVCVFLLGGNDGSNMVVPSDNATYAAYSGVRGPLALPQASLMPLSGIDFGLHPALGALSTAWNAGQLAPVFNVGPLRAPLTKAQYTASNNGDHALLPGNLFSHSDQQNEWQSATADPLTRTGWGGRASAVLGTANPVISLAGSARFGQSDATGALVLPGPGQFFGAYDVQSPTDPITTARRAALDVFYAEAQDAPLGSAYNQIERDAFTMSSRLGSLVKVQPGDPTAVSAIDTAFAPVTTGGKVASGLASQLYQTAKLIEANATVQGNRQIFFASMGGFDTHSGQVVGGTPTDGDHARLLKSLGDALAAFHAAMQAIGLGNQVTAFTQSDFGRTFKPNASNGTDHAWGNHHLVLGGAIHGGASYGSYPDLTLGGPNDVGTQSWEQQGRWIPTTGVDQYAATLLRWFGAADGQLDQMLPNLASFGAQRTLGFL